LVHQNIDDGCVFFDLFLLISNGIEQLFLLIFMLIL